MNLINQSLAILFHPVDSFLFLKKKRGSTNYAPAFILVSLAVILRIASIFIEHFPLAAIAPKDANIWMEIIRIVVPYGLIVVSCYAVTTILDGETLFGEMALAAAYSLLPYIILIVPVTVFSHIVSLQEFSLYSGLHTLIWGWVFVLSFISVQTMNGYSFSKTVGVVLLTALTMAIIVGLALLLFAMTSQALDFFKGVFLELKLLIMD